MNETYELQKIRQAGTCHMHVMGAGVRLAELASYCPRLLPPAPLEGVSQALQGIRFYAVGRSNVARHLFGVVQLAALCFS